MVAVASQTVEGHVSRGFEAVREVFAENFIHRHELGGDCCAYVHGEKVVDLWGGIRNKLTGEPRWCPGAQARVVVQRWIVRRSTPDYRRPDQEGAQGDQRIRTNASASRLSCFCGSH